MIYNAYQETGDGIAGVSVVSAGHIFAHKGREIHRPLGREDWLVFWVTKGRELSHLARDTVAEEGSFVIFKPHEVQSHQYVGEGTGEFYYVHFNAPKDFDPMGLTSSTVYKASPTSKLRDIFEEIIGELHEKQPQYEKICAARLLCLLALLSRKTQSDTPPHSRHYDRISVVVTMMNKDYAKDTSLEEYAAVCNMSKFHFLKVFREITGFSPIEYRARIRLDHAKELLRNTALSVSEIARQTGYSSGAYFCEAFKTKEGVTPSEFRAKL